MRERALHDRGGWGYRSPRDRLSSFLSGEASTYERIDGIFERAEDKRRHPDVPPFDRVPLGGD